MMGKILIDSHCIDIQRQSIFREQTDDFQQSVQNYRPPVFYLLALEHEITNLEVTGLSVNLRIDVYIVVCVNNLPRIIALSLLMGKRALP